MTPFLTTFCQKFQLILKLLSKLSKLVFCQFSQIDPTFFGFSLKTRCWRSYIPHIFVKTLSILCQNLCFANFHSLTPLFWVSHWMNGENISPKDPKFRVAARASLSLLKSSTPGANASGNQITWMVRHGNWGIAQLGENRHLSFDHYLSEVIGLQCHSELVSKKRCSSSTWFTLRRD